MGEISMAARDELVGALGGRYASSNRKERGRILDEFAAVSERTFRRWCRRFDGEGEAGLLDRRLGRASPKRMPPDDEAEIERLYRTRYQGFSAVHFHEHLTHDHLHRWSYTRVKQLLQAK